MSRPAIPAGLRRLAARLPALGDQRGAAAVELALTAPLMIAMFFGMVELGQGLVAARRVTHACGSLGDLVAQEAATSISDLGNSFAAASDILNPLPVGSLKLRVSSITMNAQNKMLVDWSQGSNGWTGYTKGAVPPAAVVAELGPQGTLPLYSSLGILKTSGDTVILSEATYQYVSPIGYILPNGLTITRSSFLRPRQGGVTCVDC